MIKKVVVENVRKIENDKKKTENRQNKKHTRNQLNEYKNLKKE